VKVIYDHDFFSNFPYSGISRYFWELIAGFRGYEDIRPSLFLGFHANAYDWAAVGKDCYRYFGIRRPKVRYTRRIFETVNDASFPLFAKWVGPDIYHQTYCIDYLPDFRGKKIVTAYDMTYEKFPKLFPSDRFSLAKEKSIRNADSVIAISESTRRDVIQFFNLPESKVSTIHLGNSLTLPAAGPRLIPEPYILFVGQRVPHKNFGALLSAYAASARVHGHFKLVCFGGRPFSKEESELIQKHDLNGKLIQVSGPDEALSRIYRDAELLVYPSLYEGFGLPVVEAMGQGCPALLSNASSLPEVGGEAAEYFDPTNREELLSKLEALLDNPTKRDDMRRRGLTQSSRFTWSACVEKTVRIYRQ